MVFMVDIYVIYGRYISYVKLKYLWWGKFFGAIKVYTTSQKNTKFFFPIQPNTKIIL